MRNRIKYYGTVLVVLIIVNFFLPRALPGSPIRSLVSDRDLVEMTAEEKMGILEAYHLNDPLHIQFAHYLKSLFTFDWGVSFSKRLPIIDLLVPAAGWTLLLTGTAIIISVICGSFLGAYSALHRSPSRQLGAILGTTVVSSIPGFWIAALLLAVFSAQLGWFPAYGAYSMWDQREGFARVLDIAWHMTLPTLALVITSIMPYFTSTRYGTIVAASSDYVKMAKFRGVPRHRITIFYVMRNAFVPVFTTLMLDVGYLLSGSILIESVFSYPGLGVLMRDAVAARDYPLIQYTFLVSALLTVLALLVADMLYHKIDPTVGVANEE